MQGADGDQGSQPQAGKDMLLSANRDLLAPGRGSWQNVGIATGGTVLSGGPDISSIGIAASGAWLGGMFGKYAPGVVDSVTGKDTPGFIYDAVGSLGTEFLGGYTKNLLNPQGSKNKPEDNNDRIH